ncbi:MAG TPA: hypothetical protein VIG24_12725 [Acidimicrobiia bacterium]
MTSPRLNQAIEEATYDITREATTIVDQARALARRLNAVANQLEVDPRGATLNELGEVQSSGPMIDAACGRLHARREALRMLHYIQGEQT